MKNKTFFKLNLIYFTALICVAALFVLGYKGIIQSEILSSFLIQIVVMFGIPLLMYTALISKNTKQSFEDAGFRKISGKMVLIAIALGLVLYLINSFVADAFSSLITLLGYENLYGSTTVKLTYGLLLKDFILSAILPGFCEEFLHRGIMLFANKKVNNPRYCLIISSLLFGLTHLNINQFFYAAILGVFMGYVDLCADSIYPSMIIHFMNNFLSSYFFYGYYLNWPLAHFVNGISSIISNNIFVFVIIVSCGVILLFGCFRLLTQLMCRECAKNKVKKIIQTLETENLTIYDLQYKINMANEILNHSKSPQSAFTQKIVALPSESRDIAAPTEGQHNSAEKKHCKSSFLDKVFLISAFFLGGLITIITFIWGII